MTLIRELSQTNKLVVKLLFRLNPVLIGWIFLMAVVTITW